MRGEAVVQSVDNSSLNTAIIRNLNKAEDSQKTAFERLGSGKQINSAADNAAGLAIAERLLSQLTAFDQSIRNASDAVSYAEVAEASLSSIGDDEQRIRKLSIQSANASLNNSDRAALQAEVSQLQQGINDVLQQSNFNGVDIFQQQDASNFQVGPSVDDAISLDVSGLAASLSDISTIDISSQAGAQAALATVDQGLQTLNDQRVSIGAVVNCLESSIANTSNNRENTAAANSRIEDADVAKEVSELIRGSIQQQSGIAVQAQANNSAELSLRLLV